MDDINFDELDKAVNSALKQAPQPETTPEVTAESPSSMQPAAQEVTAPEKAVERAIPKRRGQFMDMVHPSSDMIKSAPTGMSRQGATIQPLDPSIVEAKHEDNEKKEEPIREPGIMATTDVLAGAVTTSNEEPALHSEWPDPLDVMEQAEQNKQESMTETTSADGASLSGEPETTSEEKPSISEEPVGSPFISGPELEKRPLGAFTDSLPAGGQPGEEPDATSDESVAPEESNDGNELPAVPAVPQELTPEVVSVESDSSTQAISQESEPEGPDGIERAEGTGVAMAASISPQYKSGDEPTDGQDHPVFDTKEYHQPLTPPVKRGHTGLAVVLVVVILGLLGAGAWYAIFVLKLI